MTTPLTDIALLIALAVISLVVLHKLRHRALEVLPMTPTRRGRYEAMIRRVGPHAVGTMLVQRFLGRIQRFNSKADAHQLRKEARQRRSEGIRLAIFRDGEMRPGFVVLMVVGTFVWFFVLLLQRYLDIIMFEDLGYSTSIANVYGTVFPIIVSVLGAAFWGLIGTHMLSPDIDRLSKRVRGALAAAVLAVTIILISVLSPIAVYRSQTTIGTQVNKYELVLRQLQLQPQTPDVALEEAAAQVQVDQSKQQLSKGESLDKTLTVAAPMVEFVTSPAPIYLAELTVLFLLVALKKRQESKERKFRNKAAAVSQRFREVIMDLLVPAGVPVEQIEQDLFNGPRSNSRSEGPPQRVDGVGAAAVDTARPPEARVDGAPAPTTIRHHHPMPTPEGPAPPDRTQVPHGPGRPVADSVPAGGGWLDRSAEAIDTDGLPDPDVPNPWDLAS